MDPIEETRAGPVIRVRAKPNARNDAILGVTGGRLSVAVRAVPEKGKANAAVVAVLAEWLGVPRSSLELASGAGARDKRVLIHTMSPTELRARIAGLLRT